MSLLHALPFPYDATLIEQGGAEVDLTAISVALRIALWPASSRTIERAGEHFTHEGQAPRAFADALRVKNRSLVVDGVAYKVITAFPNEFLPHVELELRGPR